MSIADDYTHPAHDEIGVGYAPTHSADPRIAEQIRDALGTAKSVVNVDAGTGAYEPIDREVLPIESSSGRIAQRSPELSPIIRGHAECLPLPSNCVDAAMACMALHRWSDWRVGVQELRRVARKRVVILTYDRDYSERFWLLRDYLPKLGRLDSARFPSIDEQRAALGEEVEVEPVRIAHDCEDSLPAAYWRRPRAYLDEDVRAGMSIFHLPRANTMLDGLEDLADDLDSGRWDERYESLLEREQIDLGYRLLLTDL